MISKLDSRNLKPNLKPSKLFILCHKFLTNSKTSKLRYKFEFCLMKFRKFHTLTIKFVILG